MKLYTGKEVTARKTAKFMLFFGLFFAMPPLVGVLAMVLGDRPNEDDLIGAIIGFVLFGLIGGGVTLWGLIRLLRPKEYFLIDQGTRSISFVRRGEMPLDAAFEELGGLYIKVDARTVNTKNGTRTVYYHCVYSDKFDDASFYESTSELGTRRKAEEFANMFEQSLTSATGELREAGTLDQPLYQRLRYDDDAISQKPQPPGGGTLFIEALMPGYRINTRHRSKVPISFGIAGFMVCLIAAGFFLGLGDVFTDISDGVTDEGLGFIILSSFIVAIGLYALYRGIKGTFYPGSITVNTEQLQYRKHKMPLEEIEETDQGNGKTIRIISDKKIITVSAYFCSEDDWEYLFHELRRLIIEAGNQRTGL